MGTSPASVSHPKLSHIIHNDGKRLLDIPRTRGLGQQTRHWPHPPHPRLTTRHGLPAQRHSAPPPAPSTIPGSRSHQGGKGETGGRGCHLLYAGSGDGCALDERCGWGSDLGFVVGEATLGSKPLCGTY